MSDGDGGFVKLQAIRFMRKSDIKGSHEIKRNASIQHLAVSALCFA